MVHIHKDRCVVSEKARARRGLETSDDRLSGLFSARHETPPARRSRSTKIVISQPFRLSLGQKVGIDPGDLVYENPPPRATYVCAVACQNLASPPPGPASGHRIWRCSPGTRLSSNNILAYAYVSPGGRRGDGVAASSTGSSISIRSRSSWSESRHRSQPGCP